ncbi:hypothetical protein G6Z92_06280 [Vibrio aestuarianus subsp. cardii]|uniref:hypothetical protein n=1 Tax=Vibrio aestuarianus TaxID=28171 RepID=UPI0015C55628|nr:hypothetical protein [Vibrio aestuarianus]NGZ66592.1 hypothetical protein [Vibrio aestuarianus subsp. cardii]
MTTAAFFVPIHELSHAVACMIFRHKIDKVVLFTTQSHSGQLGYVKHSWNTQSLYQRVGCFFIAIAPLVTASIAVYLMTQYSRTPIIINENITYTSSTLVEEIINYSYIVAENMFKNDNINNWWMISAVALLCYHCVPSAKDFENALPGGVALIVFGVATHFLGIANRVNGELIIIASNMVTIMISATLLGMFFCLLLTAVALLNSKE